MGLSENPNRQVSSVLPYTVFYGIFHGARPRAGPWVSRVNRGMAPGHESHTVTRRQIRERDRERVSGAPRTGVCILVGPQGRPVGGAGFWKISRREQQGRSAFLMEGTLVHSRNDKHFVKS